MYILTTYKDKTLDTLDLLTPQGLGDPYLGFSDSRQAAVNAFYF
jgi:hypothetical protein